MRLLMLAVLLLFSTSAVAQDLLVISRISDEIKRYDSVTGAFGGNFATGLSSPSYLTVGPDGNVYVSNSGNNTVTRHDGQTGALIDVFISPGSGIGSDPPAIRGLVSPQGLTFGANGNLFVVSQNAGDLAEYSGINGTFVRVVANAFDFLVFPNDVAEGPDGRLYVSDPGGSTVVAVDPIAGPGQFFVLPSSGGLSSPGALIFGPNGNLFVSSGGDATVKEYNGSTGAFVRNFIAAGSGGLTDPVGISFGSDGNFYVVSRGSHSVFRYSGAGAFVDVFVPTGSGGLNGPLGATFAPGAPTNSAPIANAGPGQSVSEGTVVTLDGSGSSDPNNDPLSHSWTQVAGTAVTLDTADPVRPTFTAPIVAIGGETLSFELVVSDMVGPGAPDFVDVAVTNVNNPPIADAGPDQTVAEGSQVTLDASASDDADGEPLSFVWTQLLGTPVTIADSNAQITTFTAPLLSGLEVLSFEVTVSDGTDSVSDPMDVTVTNVNGIPVANAGPDQTVDGGTLVTLDGTGSSDPDSDPLIFDWAELSGSPVNLDLTDPARPTFVSPVVGTDETLTFELIVDDGLDVSAPGQVDVTVLTQNAAPRCDLAKARRDAVREARGRTRMISNSITGVSDPDGRRPFITILSITQDEPVGSTADALVTASEADRGQGGFMLSNGTDPNGNDGRVYEVMFSAEDDQGSACNGTVRVCVNTGARLRQDPPCTDDGQAFDSTLGQL